MRTGSAGAADRAEMFANDAKEAARYGRYDDARRAAIQAARASNSAIDQAILEKQASGGSKIAAERAEQEIIRARRAAENAAASAAAARHRQAQA